MEANKKEQKELNEIMPIAHPCSNEPNMGKCSWNWCEKYQGYLCSICGKEICQIKKVKDVASSGCVR
jgi:hypothetical protein